MGYIKNEQKNMSQLTDSEKKKSLCARLARVEGQLRGIQRLIDGDADCEKIAQQLAAARNCPSTRASRAHKDFFFSLSLSRDMVSFIYF